MEQEVELLLGEQYRAQRADMLRKLSAEGYIYTGRPDKAIEAGVAAAVPGLYRRDTGPVCR